MRERRWEERSRRAILSLSGVGRGLGVVRRDYAVVGRVSRV